MQQLDRIGQTGPNLQMLLPYFLGQLAIPSTLRCDTLLSNIDEHFSGYNFADASGGVRGKRLWVQGPKSAVNSDSDNLDQSGVTQCYLCPGPLALTVSHPLSSLHLAAPSSTLLSYHPLYLSPGADRASVWLSSNGLSGVQPFSKKKEEKKHCYV